MIHAKRRGAGLRALQKQQTKERLEAAAMQLFAERGYEATAVCDIAAAAGVSERTFFRYFPTKDAVLFHGVPDDFAQLRAFLDAHLDANDPRWADIEAGLIAFAQAMEEKYDRLCVLMNIIYGAPSVRPRLHEIRSQWLDWTGAALADPAGRSKDDPTVRMLAAIVLTIWDAANLAWLDGERTMSLAEHVTEGLAAARAALPR